MKTSLKIPPGLKKMLKAVSPSHRQVNTATKLLSSKALSSADINDLLFEKIVAGEGFFLGRPGGTESEGIKHFIGMRLNPKTLLHLKPYSSFFKKYSTMYSGVDWKSEDDLDYFCYRYLSAALSADVLAYGEFAPGSIGLALTRSRIGLDVVDIKSYDPWLNLAQGQRPWTAALENKRVLVVHPFEKTLKDQFAKRDKISGVRELLPEFSLDVLKPPVTLSTSPEGETWRDHMNKLSDEMSKRDFDVAIVGAGSYGLPLCQTIAASGRPAVHLAGSTQLLFGIAGKRWFSGHTVSPFIDDTWTTPVPEDVLPGVEKIEGGSYS